MKFSICCHVPMYHCQPFIALQTWYYSVPTRPFVMTAAAKANKAKTKKVKKENTRMTEESTLSIPSSS